MSAMNEREELEALRRLAELESREGAQRTEQTAQNAANFAIRGLGRENAEAMGLEGNNVRNMNAPLRMLGGAKAAFDKAAYGLSTMVPDVLPEGVRRGINESTVAQALGLTVPSNEEALQRAKEASAFIGQAGPAGLGGAVVGDVAMSAAPGGQLSKGVSAATEGMKRTPKVLAQTAAALGYGTGYGALVTPEDRETGAAAGAIGTGIGMGVNRALGGPIAPFVSDSARTLMKSGVQPTPGQAVGGWFNRLEEKASSIPLVGDLIRHGRNRATGEYNEAAIRTAAQSSYGFGDEAVLAARDEIGNRYNAILGQVPQLTVSHAPIARATRDAINDPALQLTDASKAYVRKYVQDNIFNRSPNLNGEIAKKIESDMRNKIQNLKTGNSTAEERSIAQALDNVYRQWRSSLTSAVDSANSGAGAALRENDAAYRAIMAVDDAASSRGAQNAENRGMVTPNQMRQAIERSDKSKNNASSRRTPTGNAPFDRLNRLTDAAQDSLTNRVPNSGTTDRAMLAAVGLGGGAGYLTNTLPAMLGGAAATGAAYSRPGSFYLTRGLGADEALASRIAALRAQGKNPSMEEAIRLYGPEAIKAAGRTAYAYPEPALETPSAIIDFLRGN